MIVCLHLGTRDTETTLAESGAWARELSREEGEAQILAWSGGCLLVQVTQIPLQQFKPFTLTKALWVKERDGKEEISHWERQGRWSGWTGSFWFCFSSLLEAAKMHVALGF